MADLRVFISYSHRDSDVVKQITQELDRLDIRYFLDEKHIDWGQRIPSRVSSGIRSCSHLLVVVSPGSRKSEWVPYEIGFAQALGIVVLPFLTHPDQDTFSFTRDLKYKTDLSDVKNFFRQLASKHRPRHFANPKPYGIADIVVDDVYLMYGNHATSLEIDAVYRQEPIEVPPEISEIYHHLAAEAKQAATRIGAQYFNGPNTRLQRFSEAKTYQGGDGLEHKAITLELAPTTWEEYTVLNTFLSRQLPSGQTIGERFASPERLYNEDRDISWCRLSNILALGLMPITSDGYGLIQYRNPRGVSSEGGRFTSGLAENIHRYLDEAEQSNLWHRLHELDLPRDVAAQGAVDHSYTPEGVPSPFLAAERGLWEELSEGLPKLLQPDAYCFLNIAFELPKFHPLLLGVVELGLSRDEVERLRKSQPGRDHSEFLEVEYLLLDSRSSTTIDLVASADKWVPAGRASVISAVHYWESTRR